MKAAAALLLFLAVQCGHADCLHLYRQKSFSNEGLPNFGGSPKAFIVQVLSDTEDQRLRGDFFRDGASATDGEDDGKRLEMQYDLARVNATGGIKIDGVNWQDKGSGPDAIVSIENESALCRLLQNDTVFRIWPDTPSKLLMSDVPK